MKSPGELLKLNIPVTISLSIILGIAVVILTVVYSIQVEWQPVVRFFGIAAGVAAGILSAYYVGHSLKVTTEQRDRALRDEKISHAFDYLRRWNDPNFAERRASWRKLLDELEGKSDEEICSTIRDDAERTTVTVDVLNFFEEMSYAAKVGVADMETLKCLCRSIVERYFSAVWPWIDRHHRTHKHQPTAYEHFEWLRNEWRSS